MDEVTRDEQPTHRVAKRLVFTNKLNTLNLDGVIVTHGVFSLGENDTRKPSATRRAKEMVQSTHQIGFLRSHSGGVFRFAHHLCQFLQSRLGYTPGICVRN